MTDTAHKIEVLPVQLDFINCAQREILYSGAFGAGKTRALCLRIAMRAQVPNSREGLARKHLVTLRATTLRTLLEPDGDLPAVLPLGSYTHNQAKKTIKIHGGGEIVYFGLDDVSKIGSYNLSGCAVDEATELTEDEWTMIRGRLRLKIAQIKNQLYGACNPGSPSHFLAARFGLAEGRRAVRGCYSVQTKSTDNFFLPESYLADLATFTGIAKARYVDGKWVGSDGLVYDRWNRADFVMSREGPWSRVIVGQDEGYTNPAVMLVVCVDSDDRLHVPHEFYRSGVLEVDIVKNAQRLREDYGVEEFVVDPAAATLRAAMKAAGIPVVAANNKVGSNAKDAKGFGGIQAVQQRLCVAGDGRARLTVDPSCENTIREFETYEWKPNKDEPIKQFDHAMDALRYAVMRLDGGKGRAWVTLAETGAPTEPAPGEAADPLAEELEERCWITL